MFKDLYNKQVSSSDSVLLTAPIGDEKREVLDEKRHWRITDKITYPDGTQKVIEHINTVVDDCSRLIASLMKGQAGMTGITYWAVGSGAGNWDNNNPPEPVVGDTKLLNETFRKAISASDITFLDSSDKPTTSVTNKLQISVTFTETEANGELREFGLFGGKATATRNSGIMINRKTHGLIYKTSGMRLERIIRIVF